MQGSVRIGTSGYVYPHWRGLYYPEKLPQKEWFSHYGRDFDTVEINNTFYRLPDASVFEKWGKAAAPGFLYVFKASRFLTHVKKLKDPEKPLETFICRVLQTGKSLGPLLYQLPPHWHVNVERLEHFLELLPADLTHVLEFRDKSWFCQEVREVLQSRGVAFCIHDYPGMECPDWITAQTVYLRFHGPTEYAYAGSYLDSFLRKTADRVAAWSKEGKDVFVFFNNDQNAYAVYNALKLKSMLQG